MFQKKFVRTAGKKPQKAKKQAPEILVYAYLSIGKPNYHTKMGDCKDKGNGRYDAWRAEVFRASVPRRLPRLVLSRSVRTATVTLGTPTAVLHPGACIIERENFL